MNIDKICRRMTSLALVMLMLITLLPGSTRAESFTAEVTVSKMLVRSANDASSPIIATLSKGKRVNVISYSDGIAYISFDGMTGYALVSNLKKVSDSSGNQTSLSGLGTISVSSAKIYSSASTSARVIYTAKRGETYTVLSTDGTWAKLQNGNYTAYTLQSNLTITANVTATPTTSATSAPTVTVAPTPTGLATITKDKTKIYKEASTNAKVMVKVDRGETYTILDMDDNWVKLENGAYQGYVQRTNVNIIPGVTATPYFTATPTPTPTPASTPTPLNVNNMSAIGTAKVNVNLVYIYTAPDTSSSKLLSLSNGKMVTLYSNSNGWALVQYATYVGYIKSDGLTIYSKGPDATATTSPTNGAISENMSVPAIANCSSPIYKSQSTSSSKLKTVSIGKELTVLGHNQEWALVKYGSTKGYMQLGAITKIEAITLSPSMDAVATVTASKAVFYKYASASSEQVGSLGRGTEVTILACDATWALVQYRSNTGYCTLSSLSEITNPTINETENVACLVVSASPIYQYASTSSSKLLSSVAKDTPVTRLGHNNNWALISYNGKTGYISAASLRNMSEVSLKSDESYTATITVAGTVKKYMYSESGSAGNIPKGMQVNVLGHNTSWALIEKSGNRGYYPLSNMQLQLDEFGSPTIKTMEATIIRSASVYSKALESSSKLGSMTSGTDITITAYTNKWVRISYGTGVGYVLKSYVSTSSYSTLKSGSSSSSDILKLQKALEDLGYFDGLPAGNYGSLTTNAVSRFQTQLGMSATGVADQATLRVLYGGYAPESSIKSESLSKGAVGNNVTRLQTRLTYKGYLSAGIDGDYGALTQSAVKLYQKVAGLTETGTADNATLRSLFSTSAPKTPAAQFRALQAAPAVRAEELLPASTPPIRTTIPVPAPLRPISKRSSVPAFPN